MHIPVNNVFHCAILQGRIFFDQDGIRAGRRLFIYQMRYKSGNGAEIVHFSPTDK